VKIEIVSREQERIIRLAKKHNQEGLRLILLGKKNESISCFKKSIELNTNLSEPYFHLGNIYIQTGHFSIAEDMYCKAISLEPNNSDYYYNIAIIKSNQNKIYEAIENYKKCLDLNPSHLKALKFLSNCYKDVKKFKEALFTNNFLAKSDPSNPEPLFNNSLIHIRNGRFDVGWKMYEEGLKENIREPLKGYYEEKNELWDGKPFDGTLIVYGEQGLGDQILYGTVLTELIKIQKKIILIVDKRLINLFRESYPSVIVISEEKQIKIDIDSKHILIGSLCKYFRKHISDFMDSEFKHYEFNQNFPYRFRKQLLNLRSLKIGISWKTFANKNREIRSLSAIQVSKILSCNNNSFINLQYGDVKKEVKKINELSNNKLNTINGLDLTKDLDNVINVIKRCDLIITIDNTIAHLAGSLGKQVWVLLPYSADFRWMENTSASLWYQNALLFRQSKNCNWKIIITLISEILSQDKVKK
tara:strand:+ start:2363 stop:3781 length:1419 start_codon:yes stop_codon:yes gene_type:complete